MVTAHSALHRKVLRDVWHLRSQLVAVAVVIACGLAMFVSLRSMHGWLRDTQAQYYAEYRFADLFASARRVPSVVHGTLAALPGVAAVRTRIVHDVTVDLPGLLEPGTARLVGIPETGEPNVNALVVQRGRWIRSGHPEEVLVSEAFARANRLVPGDSLPAVLNGHWQQLQIVGLALSPEFVYEIRGSGDIFPDNTRFGVIWMGDRALGTALDMAGAFNDVAVILTPGARPQDVIAGIDRELARYGGTGAYDRDDHVSHRFVSSEISETEITSVLIPAIFLGVTAFLLNMVLARLVTTQRDQIAVLKAFGYSNRAVATHYLQLALAPVLLGAFVGSGLGVWFAAALSTVYARFYQFPIDQYTQEWGVVSAAFVVAGGAAILGAVTAVRQAVRLPPAEAMRPAAPASFRPGIVERLGLDRIVSATDRIMMRSIERRPMRAALNVTGIALATAIVMTGWFMFDAIDVMKQIQFESVQRHDIMVTFESPRGARALWALARMDGMRQVEPFRAIPVRLRHGPRVERAGVLGLQPGSELQRLVDRHGAVRDVPHGGVLLSDVLASQLEAQAGDTLTMDVLDGKRPSRPVVVASVQEDIIGSSATMSLPALHAMLGEGGTISGAYLKVDHRRMPQILGALAETPAISGVIAREALVRGFEDTIAESFWISISLMVGFACIIAGGVIYNGARVALSERGRELASLRVLGFSRREVTRLLLGEQAILTLVGTPVGLLLGYGLAWLVAYRFESDLFRIPLVIRQSTIALSVLVVFGTALLSALAIRRRIHRLDLIAVLKTRE